MHRVDPVVGQIGCYNTQFVPPLDPLGQCSSANVLENALRVRSAVTLSVVMLCTYCE